MFLPDNLWFGVKTRLDVELRTQNDISLAFENGKRWSLLPVVEYLPAFNLRAVAPGCMNKNLYLWFGIPEVVRRLEYQSLLSVHEKYH